MAEISKPNAASTDTSNDRFALAKKAREAALAKRSGDRGEAARERTPDLGGQRLKLAVRGSVPGHVLYWENDENGKVENLLFEGFDFVTPGEVQRATDLVADMDLTNRISRFVGRQEDGSPLRAYLLKCPQAIWDERASVSQQIADERDASIRNRSMQPDSKEGRYIPAGYQSSLNTNSKV